MRQCNNTSASFRITRTFPWGVWKHTSSSSSWSLPKPVEERLYTWHFHIWHTSTLLCCVVHSRLHLQFTEGNRTHVKVLYIHLEEKNIYRLMIILIPLLKVKTDLITYPSLENHLRNSELSHWFSLWTKFEWFKPTYMNACTLSSESSC